MELINYEIWIAYQKADLKVKDEKVSSSYQNGPNLHFLSYFTVEVKFYSAKTCLLTDSFAEIAILLIKSVFLTELFTNIFLCFK